MTEQDRKKWNARYEANAGNPDPSSLLVKYLPLVSRGRALDIACGNGRNSLFLARNGFRVDAVDISDVALGRLPDEESGINPICHDLDTWEIPGNRYELIISIRFTDRRLFPMIESGLKPGGVVIFESFIGENKAYCLAPNELLRTFASFRVMYYEEQELEGSDSFDQSVSFVAVKPPLK